MAVLGFALFWVSALDDNRERFFSSPLLGFLRIFPINAVLRWILVHAVVMAWSSTVCLTALPHSLGPSFVPGFFLAGVPFTLGFFLVGVPFTLRLAASLGLVSGGLGFFLFGVPFTLALVSAGWEFFLVSLPVTVLGGFGLVCGRFSRTPSFCWSTENTHG